MVIVNSVEFMGVAVSLFLRRPISALIMFAAVGSFSFSTGSQAQLVHDPSQPAYTEAAQRATPKRRVPWRFNRRTVRYKTSEKPGTIIVDTRSHYLYFVLGRGKAYRYGVGLGRTGFGWKGTVRVGHKKEWLFKALAVDA